MHRSSLPIAPDSDRNAARAHDHEGRSMGPKWHVYPEQAAAGLWTTPTDLARFAIEVQKSVSGRSNRVLDRDTVQEMVSPVGVGSFAVGFAIAREGEGWYLNHGGGNWGFRCLLVGHKVKGYGFAIMTNAQRGAALIAELARRIRTAYESDWIARPVARGYSKRKASTWNDAETVRLVRGGRTVAEVARELDLTESALRTWVHQAEVDAGRGKS